MIIDDDNNDVHFDFERQEPDFFHENENSTNSIIEKKSIAIEKFVNFVNDDDVQNDNDDNDINEFVIKMKSDIETKYFNFIHIDIYALTIK